MSSSSCAAGWSGWRSFIFWPMDASFITIDKNSFPIPLPCTFHNPAHSLTHDALGQVIRTKRPTGVDMNRQVEGGSHWRFSWFLLLWLSWATIPWLPLPPNNPRNLEVWPLWTHSQLPERLLFPSVADLAYLLAYFLYHHYQRCILFQGISYLLFMHWSISI